jgi:hypothetical protein
MPAKWPDIDFGKPKPHRRDGYHVPAVSRNRFDQQITAIGKGETVEKAKASARHQLNQLRIKTESKEESRRHREVQARQREADRQRRREK